MTTSSELSTQLLSQIRLAPEAFVASELDEKKKRNAGKAMQSVVAQRLEAGGTKLHRQKGARYRWSDGIILQRNSRVHTGFWSNMLASQLDEMRTLSQDSPVVFLFVHFDLEKGELHVWAIPDEVAIPALDTVPENKSGFKGMVIETSVHEFKDASHLSLIHI